MTERLYLVRQEAAKYLTDKWFRTSASTLAQYASKKTGPFYLLRGPGGEALYTKDNLDEWAEGYLHQPHGNGDAK